MICFAAVLNVLKVLSHLHGNAFSVPQSEDQVVASSDYDSTHEANHSDSSDVAPTEEGGEEGGKNTPQNLIMLPAEVRNSNHRGSSSFHFHTSRSTSFRPEVFNPYPKRSG